MKSLLCLCVLALTSLTVSARTPRSLSVRKKFVPIQQVRYNSVTVQFTSFGSGIDNMALERILNVVGEATKKDLVRKINHSRAYGREGERSVCIVFQGEEVMNNSYMNGKYQKEVLQLANSSRTTYAKRGINCRTVKPKKGTLIEAL